MKITKKDAHNYWVFPDGTMLPVVSGGEGPLRNEATVVDGEGNPVTLTEEGIRIPVEQPPVEESKTPEGKVFTAEDIEKARREEKDKLYKRLEEQEGLLKELRADRDARLKAEAEAREAAEAEARKKAEEEMSVRELLQTKEQEWAERFESLRKAQEEERIAFEMERQYQSLENYRATRLSQESEEIMPELADLVRGNSEEEIEQSIAFAKDKTARILQQMTAAQQQFRQQQRGASVTAPPVGPMENDSSYKTLTAEDIRNMDMETYRQQREQILGSISKQARNKGLYG